TNVGGVIYSEKTLHKFVLKLSLEEKENAAISEKFGLVSIQWADSENRSRVLNFIMVIIPKPIYMQPEIVRPVCLFLLRPENLADTSLTNNHKICFYSAKPILGLPIEVYLLQEKENLRGQLDRNPKITKFYYYLYYGTGLHQEKTQKLTHLLLVQILNIHKFDWFFTFMICARTFLYPLMLQSVLEITHKLYTHFFSLEA
ncbi:hypothetical protein ACJX0J_007514, partial [Zea mays]